MQEARKKIPGCFLGFCEVQYVHFHLTLLNLKYQIIKKKSEEKEMGMTKYISLLPVTNSRAWPGMVEPGFYLSI